LPTNNFKDVQRVIDFLKTKAITAFFTSLTSGGDALEQSEVGISSLMDTWLLLKMIETNGERNRLIYVMKSRGMAHSNQMREFTLTKNGIRLLDVYVGPGEVLTGTARLAQEARDRSAAESERQEAERRNRELEHERSALKMQIEDLKQKMQNIDEFLKSNTAQERRRLELIKSGQDEMSDLRGNRTRRTDRCRNPSHPKRPEQKAKVKWDLRLYVAGQTDRSLKAFENLKKICEEHLEGEYRIEVIDLLQSPQLCPGRPDPGNPDPWTKGAGADSENYRRSLDTEKVLVGLDVRERS
jgi:hypothetical protein